MGEPRWIKFELAANLPKTQVFNVLTKEGGYLGQVKWFGQWRRYCFYPDVGSIYEQDCLRDIANFVQQQTAQHKAKPSQPKEARDDNGRS